MNLPWKLLQKANCNTVSVQKCSISTQEITLCFQFSISGCSWWMGRPRSSTCWGGIPLNRLLWNFNTIIPEPCVTHAFPSFCQIRYCIEQSTLCPSFCCLLNWVTTQVAGEDAEATLDHRRTERTVTSANTDLLFSLFNGVEEEEAQRKIHLVRRGRPKKPPTVHRVRGMQQVFFS